MEGNEHFVGRQHRARMQVLNGGPLEAELQLSHN